jgi:hypothetical protein
MRRAASVALQQLASRAPGAPGAGWRAPVGKNPCPGPRRSLRDPACVPACSLVIVPAGWQQSGRRSARGACASTLFLPHPPDPLQARALQPEAANWRHAGGGPGTPARSRPAGLQGARSGVPDPASVCAALPDAQSPSPRPARSLPQLLGAVAQPAGAAPSGGWWRSRVERGPRRQQAQTLAPGRQLHARTTDRQAV